MAFYRRWNIMKLIILRDPLKLDFYENLPGLHGTSILYKKARGNTLLKRENYNSFKLLPLMSEAHMNRSLGCHVI